MKYDEKSNEDIKRKNEAKRESSWRRFQRYGCGMDCRVCWMNPWANIRRDQSRRSDSDKDEFYNEKLNQDMKRRNEAESESSSIESQRYGCSMDCRICCMMPWANIRGTRPRRSDSEKDEEEQGSQENPINDKRGE